jgi:3-oxoacyl-[acyl-carrier-protein] synthase II
LALGKNVDKIIVSATKSMTGHLLGGAGALESIFSVLALKYNKAPGTINLENKDELINLNVFKETQNLDSNAKFALNNSFGFGGHNVCVVFAKN